MAKQQDWISDDGVGNRVSPGHADWAGMNANKERDRGRSGNQKTYQKHAAAIFRDDVKPLPAVKPERARAEQGVRDLRADDLCGRRRHEERRERSRAIGRKEGRGHKALTAVDRAIARRPDPRR